MQAKVIKHGKEYGRYKNTESEITFVCSFCNCEFVPFTKDVIESCILDMPYAKHATCPECHKKVDYYLQVDGKVIEEYIKRINEYERNK